jgi:hypothetical protein
MGSRVGLAVVEQQHCQSGVLLGSASRAPRATRDRRSRPLWLPAGRSAHDAIAACRQRCWNYHWVIDLDVRTFVEEVPWDLVVKAVTDAHWVLRYVQRWLASPLEHPDGSLEPRSKGTPQGSAVSPILANLFMHYAFDAWMARNFPGCTFERYADDAVVHCRRKRQAEHVLARIAARIEAPKRAPARSRPFAFVGDPVDLRRQPSMRRGSSAATGQRQYGSASCISAWCRGVASVPRMAPELLWTELDHHVDARVGGDSEPEAPIQLVRLGRRQEPSPQALQLRMRHDRLDEPFAEPAPAVRGHDEDVREQREGRVVARDTREAALRAVLREEAEQQRVLYAALEGANFRSVLATLTGPEPRACASARPTCPPRGASRGSRPARSGRIRLCRAAAASTRRSAGLGRGTARRSTSAAPPPRGPYDPR